MTRHEELEKHIAELEELQAKGDRSRITELRLLSLRVYRESRSSDDS